MAIINTIEEKLGKLFLNWSGTDAKTIQLLPPSGSNRRYYRLSNDDKTAIGVYNTDLKENFAFLGFSRHFLDCKLPVAQILDEDLNNNCYLLEDLGNATLFSLLPANNPGTEFDKPIIDHYKKVLDFLPKFQVEAGRSLDYSLCYPRHAFDKRSMMWDMNYFKYYFLKLAPIAFDEQKLEDAFQDFAKFLLEADGRFFLYRDFQSRNIMVFNGEPYFIDFQGGRKGPLQYDLASLLFDAKANIPFEIRKQLLEYYLDRLEKHYKFDRKKFSHYFYGFVIIRIMQAMGAYGFRGFYERKPLFLQSIPYAINNIRWLLDNKLVPKGMPYIEEILGRIAAEKKLEAFPVENKKLKVVINSFSYKKGFPDDPSGNGGGYVFDCRALPNPGRYEEYKQLTGADKDVMEFIEQYEEFTVFLKNAFSFAELSINNYIERSFSNLMISFGCTGGQHRSVYCANKLYQFLKEKYTDIIVEIQHREQPQL